MDITFLLNGEVVSLSNVSPTTTLLDWLREERGLTGTKEGWTSATVDSNALTATVGDTREAMVVMVAEWRCLGEAKQQEALALRVAALEGALEPAKTKTKTRPKRAKRTKPAGAAK